MNDRDEALQMALDAVGHQLGAPPLPSLRLIIETAVDAALHSVIQEGPCDVCSGYGCPECSDEVLPKQSGQPSDGAFPVRLEPADADHLLAVAEWGLRTALSHSLGPGLNWSGVERAARKIEAVADMARRGMEIE